MFFLSLFQLTGGSNVSLDDLQKLPPAVTIDEVTAVIDKISANLGPSTESVVDQLAELRKQIQALEVQVRPELGTMAQLQQDNVPWLQFDTTPAGFPTGPNAHGTLYWDDADSIKTLNLVMEDSGGVVQQIGEETYYRIKADAAITNGQVVMFTGTVGASGGLKGAPATGLTAFQNEYIMGVATQDIANNSWGYVTWFGLVRGINTTGGAEAWVDGQILYYNPAVPGGLTKNVPTAPNPKVIVASVVHAATNGSLFVRPSFGSALGSTDSNVQIGTLANGNLLIYNNSTSRWENATLTAGSNVTITNGPGSITIASSNPGGTVTSVNASGGTTGMTFTGGPITSSGTLTLGGTLGTANGGTGLTSYTANGVLYASATNTLATKNTFLFDGTNMAVNTTSLGVYGVLTIGDTNGTAGFGAPNVGFGDWVYAGGPGNTLRIGPSGYNSGPIALMYTTSGGVRIEGLRLTSTGGVSFGSSGTAFGTANQILQSNGNAPPTWTSTPTISGTNFTGIPNGALTNSSVTINGSSVSLGGSVTVTAVNPFTLTIGTGLSGTSYNGSAAVTIANTGVLSFSGGTTGLTPNTATTGAVTLAGTLAVGNGGTGTSTAFTAGSAVFAGTSGVYSQDNTNYFWDNTNKRLGLGTNSPQQRFDVRGTPGATIRIGSLTHGGSGDEFGNIEFWWADPDAAEVKAKIYAKNVGNVGPGGGGAADLLFATTPAFGASTERMRILSTGVVQPGADNTQNLGAAAFRWATIFAGNGTINTSDRNQKTQIEDLDEVEKRVGIKIRRLFKKFKMVDAVAAKGDSARIHFGAVAQDVQEAFASEGLDANNYGVFCVDTWREHNGVVVQTDPDGMYTERFFEVDGKRLPIDRDEELPENAKMVTVKHPTVERTRLGLRYDELFAFVIATL